MRYEFLRAGSLRLLVTHPDTSGFGNAVLNMATSFHMAQQVAARLAVAPTDPARYAVVCGLQCAGVQVTRWSGWRARLWEAVVRLTREAAPWLSRLGIPVTLVAFTNIVDPRQSKDEQKAVRGVPVVHGAPGPLPQDGFAAAANCGVNLREAYARRPLALETPVSPEMRRAAQALGIAEDARIVTLHVREPGYAAVKGFAERDKDSPRNARIESYGDATDWLAARGMTVVRIGDPSMTPFPRPGVIDLATSPLRTDALELWLVLRSRLFIASDCGAHNLAVLANIPCVGVNMTQIVAHYPLRRPDRYVLKRVWDVDLRRQLSLEEMLTPQHLKDRFVPGRYQFLDNTPAEIRAVVDEALQASSSGRGESEVQRAFRTLFERLVASKWGERRLAKPGMNGPFFLGDGAIGDAFARSCLRPADVAEAS